LKSALLGTEGIDKNEVRRAWLSIPPTNGRLQIQVISKSVDAIIIAVHLEHVRTNTLAGSNV